MAEHLLIADLGALLLVLGLTGPVLAPVLRIRAFDRLRVLAHPLVAFPLWAVDLYLWHVPALHEAAVRHSGVHALQHMSFVFFGANMWMALLGPLPKPSWFGNFARLVYVIAVRLTGAVLGNVFVFGGHVFYGVYAAGERAHGISPGADQNAAGAIMMIEGSLLTLGLFAWLFARTRARGRSARRCSTWRSSAASSSPTPAPRAPSPPGAAPSCASGSSGARQRADRVPSGRAFSHEPHQHVRQEQAGPASSPNEAEEVRVGPEEPREARRVPQEAHVARQAALSAPQRSPNAIASARSASTSTPSPNDLRYGSSVRPSTARR